MAQSKVALSAQLLEKARVELNEVQSEVTNHMQTLRQRILADPKLNFRTDDAFLLRFLRTRKFNQERAFELLTNYYRQREKFQSLYSKAVSFYPREGWNSKVVELLPNRDSQGRAVIVISYRHWDCNLLSVEDLLSLILLHLEGLLQDKAVQINGIVYVCDFEGLTLGILKQWTPRVLKELVSVFFNAFPLRVKAVHYVNMTPLLDNVIVIFKSLISQKMQGRLIFHGNCLASFHEHFDTEILPLELGGDLDPPEENLWIETMKKAAEALAEDLKYGFKQG